MGAFIGACLASISSDEMVPGNARGESRENQARCGAEVIGHGHGHGHGNGRERGYTLVIFVMAIAVMSIAMGVAVQTVEFQMRREREAELIFRGEQFIEAIRLYKVKYGRYPMQLKEIYEAKPRVVRKKWKDPITDSEKWGIIFLGQEGRPGQQGRQRAGPGATGGSAFGDTNKLPNGPTSKYDGNSGNRRGQGQGTGTGLGVGQAGKGPLGTDGVKMGPIVGVHSTSCDEAIKIYEGRTTYCEWRFIYREQPQQGGAGGQTGRRSGKLPNQPEDDLPFGVPRDALKPPGSRDPGGSGPLGNRPPPVIP
jgi:type II secretory pathway pseudopilin PulG